MVQKRGKINKLHINDNHGTINQDVINIILEREQKLGDFVITKSTDTTPTNLFLGRQDELKDLREYISTGDKLVLVSGMGGIGKTHLCRYLYKEYLNAYKNNEVVCIDHIGYLNYSDSLDNTLINGLKIKGSDESTFNIDIAWARLTELSENKKILLFIDNVNKTMQEDESLKKLYNIRGTIIITARKREFERFVPYDLGCLSYDECKALFENIYGEVSSSSQEDLKYIIEVLAGKHTKTVELIGHMAKVKDWDISILYNKLCKHHFNLSLNVNNQDLNLQKEYEKLFNISSLSKNDVNVLEAFSLFPPLALPNNICHKWMDADAHIKEDTEIYYKLYQKGWIEKNDTGYYMHPVISETVFSKYKPKALNHKKLLKTSINFINIADKNDFKYASFFIPFTDTIVEKLWNKHIRQFSIFSIMLSEFFSFCSIYSRALYWAEKSLEIEKYRIIKDNIIIEYIQREIAGIYDGNGNYVEALNKYNEILRLCRTKMSIATTNNSIARVFLRIGQHEEALEKFKDTLSIMQEELKEEDLRFISIYDDLSNAYSFQGKYELAIKYGKQALKLSRKGNGIMHFDTAQLYNNLAARYKDKGDYLKALILFYKSLIIDKEIVGESHLEYGITCNNIALIKYHYGAYEEALNWFNKALKIKINYLGEMHPMVATTENNIGLVYGAMNDYDKSLEWFNKALNKRKIIYENHPLVAETYCSIGMNYYFKGEYQKALELLHLSLDMFGKYFGSNHPDIISVKSNLALIYLDMKEYGEALKQFESLLEITNGLSDKNYPSIASLYNNIGGVYYLTGENDKALLHFLKSFKVLSVNLGNDYPGTKAAYLNIFGFYIEMGNIADGFDDWLEAEIGKI